jgi:hypothetical protein
MDDDDDVCIVEDLCVPPVQAAPVQAAPVQAAPVQAAPVQSRSVEVRPVEGPPVEGPPVETAPVQAAQVQSRSVEVRPVEGRSVSPPPVEVRPVNKDLEEDNLELEEAVLEKGKEEDEKFEFETANYKSTLRYFTAMMEDSDALNEIKANILCKFVNLQKPFDNKDQNPKDDLWCLLEDNEWPDRVKQQVKQMETSGEKKYAKFLKTREDLLIEYQDINKQLEDCKELFRTFQDTSPHFQEVSAEYEERKQYKLTIVSDEDDDDYVIDFSRENYEFCQNHYAVMQEDLQLLEKEKQACKDLLKDDQDINKQLEECKEQIRKFQDTCPHFQKVSAEYEERKLAHNEKRKLRQDDEKELNFIPGGVKELLYTLQQPSFSEEEKEKFSAEQESELQKTKKQKSLERLSPEDQQRQPEARPWKVHGKEPMEWKRLPDVPEEQHTFVNVKVTFWGRAGAAGAWDPDDDRFHICPAAGVCDLCKP